MRDYNSYQPVDLRKKSFNVQCYCDVRDFEYIARTLAQLGSVELPVKTSTVLNQIIIVMKDTLERKEEKSSYCMTASKAVEGLRKLGISTGQFRGRKDRRGSLLVKHLQSDELAIEAGDDRSMFVSGSVEGISGDDASRAIKEIEDLHKTEHEDFSALGVVPDQEDVADA